MGANQKILKERGEINFYLFGSYYPEVLFRSRNSCG